MATLEQQVESTEQAFEELAGKGHEWVSLDDVARRAMKRDHEQRRQRRGRLVNSIADYFVSGSTGKPPRIPFRYRHQTQLATGELERIGRLEHRFLDAEGHLRKDPPGRRDYRDRRYRLVPEAAQGPEGSEVSPRDRFESVARRIEDLPGAAADGEGQEAVTAVSAEIKAPRNKSWPRPTTLDLRVAYLPSRSEDSERDPQSIAASWSTPTAGGGTAEREAYLSIGQLDSGDPEAERMLGVLEDSVQAVELSNTSAAAEDGLRDLMHRTFSGTTALQAQPLEASLAVRRDDGPHVM